MAKKGDINGAYIYLTSVAAEIKDLRNKMISAFPSSTSPHAAYVDDLIKDLDGQASEALSKHEWWSKWGIHYLPSLMMAHEHQYCNNFKVDPSFS